MDQQRRQKAHHGSVAGERRIDRLIDRSAPGIWDWDLPSDSFLVTPRLRAIFGFQNYDPIDFDALLAATHPDDRSWADLRGDSSEGVTAEPVLAKFRIRKIGSGEMRWVASRIWRDISADDSAKVVGYSGTVTDITDEVTTAAALSESEGRLRLAIEAGKMAVWEVDLESGEMTQSPDLNILCGFALDATTNLQDVRALYNPGEIERLAMERNTVEEVRARAVGGAFEPWRPGALKAGGDRTQIQAEVAITTPAGIPKRLMLRAQYAVSQEGKRRITGLLFDITETKMAEERIALVARELQHRVRNLLSVIGSIAAQSLRGKADRKDELKAFHGRLDALAAANELILARSSSAADLRALIEKIITPYYIGGVSQFVLDGAEEYLQANAATAFGMVVHELCTNAVKYGALSAATGEVLIQWRRSGPDLLTVVWQEQNGPLVAPPKGRGFGSRLMESVLSGQLGGKVALDFRPEGVRCQIDLHLQK